MKTFLFLVFSLFLSSQAQEVIPLWPENQLPNSKGLGLEEREENQRTRVVKYPTVTAFFPNQEHNTGMAVVICPGGGYRHLAIHKEGYQIAKWLNTKGINAFVLKYRLPESEDLIEAYKAPMQDAQRAIRLVRANAKEWKIDPQKVGIMGGSAGGHLAASVATHPETDWSKIEDNLDTLSFAPNFLILLYPVVTGSGSLDRLMGTSASEKLRDFFTLDRHVNAQTPPTFLIHADDDSGVTSLNSIRFYEALKKRKVSAEMHIFRSGGHGFGLGYSKDALAVWPVLLTNWLEGL